MPGRSQSTVAVRCVRVPAALPANTAARWLKALPKARRSTLACRLSRAGGLETLTGLALLTSMSSACRLPPLGRLRWTSRGKPEFPDGPDFSIAHSGGFAACAVAPRGLTIGIDVEPVNRARIATIRLIADDKELSALERGSMTATGLWTCKEAVLKAAGAGLADICRVCVAHDRARFAGVDYYLRSLKLNGDLLLAIAMRWPIPELRIEWTAPSEIFGLPAETGCS